MWLQYGYYGYHIIMYDIIILCYKNDLFDVRVICGQ